MNFASYGWKFLATMRRRRAELILRSGLLIGGKNCFTGGLATAEKRQIKALADRFTAKSGLYAPSEHLFEIGTRLVRDWRGRTYHVAVTAAGFEMDGTVHASLTAAARAITGTHWPGPRFFGLRRGDRQTGEANWVQHAARA